ncbi:probable G-protein coupled receptor 139 [Heterodontus francisci]|uniref:probable G-protein coupled receptor 139 n=1 Tax=Heterodontus francisci TaxID=7792 RepID=UPI00355BDE1B
MRQGRDDRVTEPWITRDVEQLVKRKKEAYLKVRKQGSDRALEGYKVANKEGKNGLRRARRGHEKVLAIFTSERDVVVCEDSVKRADMLEQVDAKKEDVLEIFKDMRIDAARPAEWFQHFLFLFLNEGRVGASDEYWAVFIESSTSVTDYGLTDQFLSMIHSLDTCNLYQSLSLAHLFSLLSLTVNLLAIVILSRGKCGLSTCTTRYLVAMATADLLVIITELILWTISFYYFRGSFLNITPVCSVNIVLIRAATDCSVWFTVTFTFDRFVAIFCQKLKTKYCTKKTVAVVLATTCILLCSKNIPFYFAYEPGEIIDNVPFFCYTKPSYYIEPGWVGFDWFETVLTPLLPFALILLLNTLTVRHILVASRVRKGLRGQSKGENRSDPEMESRRKSVILLFTISGNFILLWLVHVIEFFYYHVTGTDKKDYTDSEYILQEVGWMLLNLSCCTNTFIYVVTQSKFREQVKSAVKYPVTSIIQLMN